MLGTAAGQGQYPTLLYLSLVPIIALVVVIAINWDPTGIDVDGEHVALRAEAARTGPVPAR
jgi:hypothetical protein